MTAALRLFTIETRRNAGLWLFPVLVGLAWYAGREPHPDGVTLWIESSFGIGRGMMLAGLAAAGLAAYVAGRDRRRGMSELLATTPRPAATRGLALWSATAIWGVLAYLAAGAYLLTRGYLEATWSGPEPSPIIVGLVAMVAYPALGYAAGALVPSRFVVPLVPIVLYVAQGLAIYQYDSPVSFLSPWAFMDSGQSVFWRVEVAWGLWISIWLLGLGALALAVTVARRERTRAVEVGLAASVLIATVAGGALLSMERSEGMEDARVAYELVCADTAIPVCVHPGYEAMLDETVAVAGPVLTPLAAIPGAPAYAGQVAFGSQLQDDVLAISPWAPGFGSEGMMAYGIAADLVAPDRYGPDPNFTDLGFGITESQGAMILWLLHQANPSWATAALEGHLPLLPNAVRNDEYDEHLPRLIAAAERLEALAPDERRAWLEAHFADVRSGRLALEDLP